jgi:hypothetical protein
MKKRYIIGATAALISAGLMIEMQAGSTGLNQVDILEAQAVAAAGGGLGGGSRPTRGLVPASTNTAVPGTVATPAPGEIEIAAAGQLAALDTTGLSDEALLLADRSPWAELPPGEGRLVWDHVAARLAMVSDEFDMVGQDDNSYPLAGPINAAHGGDALAAALSQPANFSTVPEPGNWLSMIVGLALVGYTLRRRNRVPTVSS